MAAKRIPRDHRTKRKAPSRFSGLIGAACGLGLGLAIAAVIYFKDRHPDAPAVAAVKAVKRKPHASDTPEGDSGSGTGGAPPKSYAFYDQLPKFEVVVPEKEKAVKRDVRDVPETRRGTYVVQAGSYNKFADADRIRAQLALQGIESKVQPVAVASGSSYRVRIGPIFKLDQLNKLYAKLRKADFDPQVIRVGD